jgi:alkanesulfonate monooxygenase SsuD/methylene tetrahydromethanopterin reductase-like flavin-dependent oxidoreductase (luciferase family)
MPRPLQIGVQLPEVERHVGWAEYVAMARAAEDVGFDSVWVGDHLLYRGDGRPERGPWDAWALLAGIAAVTERVRLGPLVACLAFHPPGLIARMAAAVHELSGGRFVLGVGAGWNEVEFQAFGIPFDRRASRFEEGFEIVRRLLAGERVTFHGRFEHADDAVLLPRSPSPVPLMVGSIGRRVLGAALPHVDAWNTWFADYGNTAEGFERSNATTSRIAEEVGRDPTSLRRSACVLVVIDRQEPERPLEDVPPIEGTTGRIANAIHGFAEAGADEVIVVLDPITERSIREFGEVLRALRRA